MVDERIIMFVGARAIVLAARLTGWLAWPMETLPDPSTVRARLASDWNIGGIVLDLHEHDDAVLDWLGRQTHPSLIAIVDPASADTAGALAWRPATSFVAPDAPTPELISVLLDALAPAGGQGVAELSERAQARAQRFSREIESIGSALAGLSPPSDDARAKPNGIPVEASYIRLLLKARRLRDRHFSAELFSDPAWDMLLDLTAARLDGRRVSVSSLCIAAAVPTTTALRWIRNLCDDGLFERELDPHDARRAFIDLSEPTFQRILSCLAALRTTLPPAP